MKKSVKTMVCLGLATLSLGIYAPGQGLAQEPVTMSLPQKMDNGETIEVYYRKGNSIDAPRARGAELKQETLLLKAGTIRREGAKPLTCDIVMEKDVPVTLRDGTVIYVDIGIWPMGMKYHKGESLRLTIEPYKAPGKEAIPAFGSAKIVVPQSGYTYDPKEKPAMKTLGGQAETSAHPEYEVKAPAIRNKGQHIFHIGGKYDSFLLVPVVPEK